MIQNRNIVITNIRTRTTTISYINLNLIEKEDEQIDMIIENFRKSPQKTIFKYTAEISKIRNELINYDAKPVINLNQLN